MAMIPHKRPTLAIRDIYIMQIEKEIEGKRMFIVNKKKELEQQNNDNEFLDEVRNNYGKYYNYILKEKQQQLKSMHMIEQYLADLVKTDMMLDHELKEVERDHEKTMQEIKKITTELDQIIN